MMYQLFNNYLNTTQLIMTGILFTFFITFLALKFDLRAKACEFIEKKREASSPETSEIC